MNKTALILLIAIALSLSQPQIAAATPATLTTTTSMFEIDASGLHLREWAQTSSLCIPGIDTVDVQTILELQDTSGPSLDKRVALSLEVSVLEAPTEAYPSGRIRAVDMDSHAQSWNPLSGGAAGSELLLVSVPVQPSDVLIRSLIAWEFEDGSTDGDGAPIVEQGEFVSSLSLSCNMDDLPARAAIGTGIICRANVVNPMPSQMMPAVDGGAVPGFAWTPMINDGPSCSNRGVPQNPSDCVGAGSPPESNGLGGCSEVSASAPSIDCPTQLLGAVDCFLPEAIGTVHCYIGLCSGTLKVSFASDEPAQSLPPCHANLGETGCSVQYRAPEDLPLPADSGKPCFTAVMKGFHPIGVPTSATKHVLC